MGHRLGLATRTQISVCKSPRSQLILVIKYSYVATIPVNPSYKIQLLNVKHKIKIVSFKKLSKVGDVGFSANVFGESVACGRNGVRKGMLTELGAKSR